MTIVTFSLHSHTAISFTPSLNLYFDTPASQLLYLCSSSGHALSADTKSLIPYTRS